ncbi:MAG TPA: hypothetical protein VMW15_14360 [Terracidiphilus sp.]|nr:hypothetical protein [Terracidiphilus sp.]HUX27474.1 hypothetical protein [Terracidiphilus sp.]
MAVFLACVPRSAHPQSVAGFAPERSHPVKERSLPGGYPNKPSVPPSFTIPVEPLGFSPPGPLYLGQRNSVASLDFIDENRLLFTFRVPGLIHRELKAGESGEDERRIRAVVLTVSTGAVEAEGVWTVHDRTRYLWMLKDGHFLFRDQENLQQGDAQLQMKPFLQFPGRLLWVDLDPSERFMVSDSREPVATVSKPGEVGSPATASATTTEDSEPASSHPGGDAGSDSGPEPPPDVVLRILHRASGQVMLVSRVRSLVHLPINSEGYLESLRGRGLQWTLNLNLFTGGSRVLGSVDSTCLPNNMFLSEREVLVTACSSSGGHALVAMTTGGKTLWADVNPDTAIWPLLARSPDGLRVVQETLAVDRPISAFAPLSTDDIKGQLLRVFDAATGEVAFESPLSPILDAGGNAAISPSGRRIAVLNDGAIQVFELPPPPPLPDAGAK